MLEWVLEIWRCEHFGFYSLILSPNLSPSLSPFFPPTDKLTFAIAVEVEEDVRVSYNTRFLTHDEAACGRLWGQFNTRGEVRDADRAEEPSPNGQPIGAALCVKVLCFLCLLVSHDMSSNRFLSLRSFRPFLSSLSYYISLPRSQSLRCPSEGSHSALLGTTPSSASSLVCVCGVCVCTCACLCVSVC